MAEFVSLCNSGTLPRILAISIALTNLTLFLESIFFARSGSNFFKYSNNTTADFEYRALRSFGFGGTCGKIVPLVMASI